MIGWLLTRNGLLVGAVLLAVAVGVGILFREGNYGNIASIVGLAVSVLGFLLTIATVLDARHQVQEAAAWAERAIHDAGEETRRVVEGIAYQLLAADCAALRTGVEDLR